MLLGYVEFLVLLFLPGLAVLEIFRVGESLSFAERLGLAFGLSMAVDVLVLAFRTSGLLIGSQLMLGIYPLDPELILVASLVAFLVPVAIRRRVTWMARPLRHDLYVLGLVAVQGALVAVHFSKYPIFPEYQSADFLQHVDITQSLESGGVTLLPGGLLYFGIHLLMGSLGALTGDLLLVVTQRAMGILVSLSPLLVFAAVAGLSESKRIGLIAALVYVASGFVWFGSVFNAGLYANFYGLLAILLIFALVPIALKSPRSLGVWVAFALAIGNGYLSHYSFVTIIPALFALPVGVLVLDRRVSWPHVAIPVAVLAPAALVAAAKPSVVGLMLSFLQASGAGSISGNTALSQALAGWPVLRYAVVEVTNDLTSLAVIALAIAGTYLVLRGKRTMFWVVLVWLVALMAVAPLSEAAWRFSYMALLPLLMLGCYALDWLIPSEQKVQLVKKSKMRVRRNSRNYRIAALVLISLLLTVDSWSWKLVADAASNGVPTANTQRGILASMEWMNSTLPRDSNIVSVTSSDYAYFNLIYPGRVAGYDPLATPDTIEAASTSVSGPVYVILTQVGTTVAPQAGQNPYELYPNDTLFQQVYNQTGVTIFELR